MRIIKMITNGQMFYLLSNSFNYASVQMDLIKNLQLRAIRCEIEIRKSCFKNQNR